MLAGAVQPFALPIIEDHRASGRLLVLATTTPDDMIRPLADRLGFDDVVATRYGLDGEGRYDGSIDGEFVWGPGKLRAVRAWAASTTSTWPRATPTPTRTTTTRCSGPWATRWPSTPTPACWRWPPSAGGRSSTSTCPPGVPKVPVIGIEPQRIVQSVVRPELLPWVRFDIDGVDNIPEAGPAIVVANHRSYFDLLALGATFAKRGRAVRFLGKKEVFDAPVVGSIARALGGIRVDRGTGSDDPLVEAAAALASGELVAILPRAPSPGAGPSSSPS